MKLLFRCMILPLFLSGILSCQTLLDKIAIGNMLDPFAINDPILSAMGAKPQKFEIDANKVNVIAGEKGTRIFIPAQSFVDEKGVIITGKVDITMIEISRATEIAGSNIPMDFSEMGSGDALFLSGGMFRFSATYQNKTVAIREGKSIQGLFSQGIGSNKTESEQAAFTTFQLNQRGRWERLSQLETPMKSFVMNTHIKTRMEQNAIIGTFTTTYLKAVKQLYITGTMNNWEMPGIPMTKNSEGNWEIELDVSKGIKYKYFADEIDERIVYLPEYHIRFVPIGRGPQGSFTAANFQILANSMVDIRSYRLQNLVFYPTYNLDKIMKNLFVIKGKVRYDAKVSSSKIMVRNIFVNEMGSIQGDSLLGSFKVQSGVGVQNKVLITDEQGYAGVSKVIVGKDKSDVEIPEIVMKKVPQSYMISQEKLLEFLGLKGK
jgi:hypothetical protein